MNKKLLILAVCLLCATRMFAVCNPGYSEIIVQIVPDQYAYETHWNIVDALGDTMISGGSVGDTICIGSGSCVHFTISDDYGDGIYSPGGFWLYVDGSLVSHGSAFGFGAQYSLSCPAGSFCTNAIPLSPGTWSSIYDDSWYSFTPGITGTYDISTCSMNTCDTKIWVYNTCPSVPYDEGPPGTYAFNDDAACGIQADLSVIMMAGTTYYIRIGDNADACIGSIDFSFSYTGSVQGCMDPSACNFNPLAQVDDGSCIYYPNPNCTGPDLQFDSATFVNSLGIMQHTTSGCDVNEGCVVGYGQRYVLSFTSKINNIGTLDFYIGTPGANPGMFNTNNCHGHAHYEGYGDYRLFDSSGNLVPAGHKNGFCVMDLCGFGHYNCSDMGISVGCYDQYGAGTQCQWLDITDVPTGDYRLAVIINSRHLPDALGRNEMNFLNNALQVCMHITHNVSGAPTYTLLPNCAPYVDCLGVPAGSAELDCNGLCNGPGVFGDAMSDGTLNDIDIDTYMDLIEFNLPAVVCYDLDANSKLTVADAALVNWCRNGNQGQSGGSTHNHCHFPRTITNPNDTVGLSISALNYTDNYIDIEVNNPTVKLKAYQFNVSGITISSVVSLADPVDFPVDVRFKAAGNEVFAISHVDSMLQRSMAPQQLVRIYYSAITDTQICISAITDLINQNAEQTIHTIYNGCRSTATVGIASIMKPADLVIIPNPAREKAMVHISLPAGGKMIVTDADGRIQDVRTVNFRDEWYEMDLRSLPAGVYFLRVQDENVYGVTRFVKM